MADAILDAMGAALTRWAMGSAAAPGAVIWKAELGVDANEAELRLLALSGQFLAVSVTATPPTEAGPGSRMHSVLLERERRSSSSKCCHIRSARKFDVGGKAMLVRTE